MRELGIRSRGFQAARTSLKAPASRAQALVDTTIWEMPSARPLVAWPAMDRASEPSIRAPGAGALVLTGLVGAALAAAMFAGDGSDVGGILPVGGAAVVLLASCARRQWRSDAFRPRGSDARARCWSRRWLRSPRGRARRSRGRSSPDRSWDSFDKTVAYAAFLGLGIVLAAAGGRFSARLAAAMLSLVIAITLTWALLAKAVPALDPDGDRVARLREPVGYWNALALLADMALALGLWLGTAPGHRRSVRVAGGLLVYVATLSLLLTLSRAGVLVAVGVLVLWLALSTERVESGLLLLASAGPAVLVGAWAFTRPALTEDVATRSDRVADGAVFGALALAGAGVVAVLVALGTRRALAEDARRRVGRVLVVVAARLRGRARSLVSALATANAVSSGRSCSEVVQRSESVRVARPEQQRSAGGARRGMSSRGIRRRARGRARSRSRASAIGRTRAPCSSRTASRCSTSPTAEWPGWRSFSC